MADVTTTPVHWSFWLISVVALIWNLMGGANFFVQIFAPDLANMPEWWRAFVESRPIWVTAAMTVGVFSGVAGCIALLMKRAVAYPLFLISLVGTAIVVAFSVTVPGAGARQIFEGVVMPVVTVGFLIWYARLARGKGWIT